MFIFFNHDEIKRIKDPVNEQLEKKVTKSNKQTKELDMYSYAKLLEKLDKGSFGELREMLLDNIREEAANKNGSKKPFKIIQNMFKKTNNESFENKAIALSDGRFAFIDGYRVFIADTDLGYTKRADFNLEPALGNLELDREIEIDTSELKRFTAVVKAEKNDRKPFIIDCGNDYYIGVNPFFLKDAIDFSGITKMKYQKSRGQTQKTPMYFIDDSGKIVAIVLPVNINVPVKQAA